MIKVNVILRAMYKNRSNLILGILIEAFVMGQTHLPRTLQRCP